MKQRSEHHYKHRDREERVMGFFSRIFGGHQKKAVGRVSIGFYDVNRAFVHYEQLGPNDNTGIDQWNLACAYYAEVLASIANTPQAPQLYEYIGQIAERSVEDGQIRRLTLLAEGQELLPAGQGAETMVHQAALYEQGEAHLIEVAIPTGGSDYFTPTSMVLLLQYLIRTMDNDHLALLIMALKSMNNFYRDVKPFTDPQARLEAPGYGMTLAVEYAKEAAAGLGSTSE